MLSLWLVFLSAVTLCVATSVDDCPDNLKRDRFLQAYSGYCFYFHMHIIDDAREYRAARKVCKNDGGTLALIKTSELNGFLQNKLYHDYNYRGQIWFGLTDLEDEGTFMWEDGTPLSEWQNWAPGSGPEWIWNDAKFSFVRDCVTLDTTQDGRWVEDWCRYLISNNKKAFVCQFKAKPTKPTTTKRITLKPTTLKPNASKPTTSKPTTSKPTTSKLTTQRSATPKSTTPKPTTQTPTTQRPTTQEPASQKPTTHKLTTEKPTTQRITTQRLTTQKPTTQKPTTQKPITQKPTTQKTTTQKTTTQKPSTQKTTIKTPVTLSTTVVPKTAKPTCPPFVCDTDCGMDGYKSDPVTGCTLCQCDDE